MQHRNQRKQRDRGAAEDGPTAEEDGGPQARGAAAQRQKGRDADAEGQRQGSSGGREGRRPAERETKHEQNRPDQS